MSAQDIDLSLRMQPYFALELGGTKINVASGTSPNDLSPIVRIETRDPSATMAEILSVLHDLKAKFGNPAAIGVASFGPIGLDKMRDDYGTFLNTPKPGWSGYNMIAPLKAAFGQTPIHLDTDVNAAALGEGAWGAAQSLNDYAYVTIGTGVGFGIIVNGRPVHGLLHPEAGHVLVRRVINDPFAGVCPFHGDCLEGMVSGPSLKRRLGFGAERLNPDAAEWDLVGNYLAQGLMNVILTSSPQKIMVGGGVGLNPAILRPTRDHLHAHLGGYIEALRDRTGLDDYIVPAALGDRAGIIGALVLARLLPNF